MIRVRVSNVRSNDLVASFSFEPVLNIGRTEAPQRFARHNTEQQIVSAGSVL